MRKKQISHLIGLGLGVAGAVAGFLIWRQLKSLAVFTVAEEAVVGDALIKSIKKAVDPEKKTSRKTTPKKKVTPLAKEKVKAKPKAEPKKKAVKKAPVKRHTAIMQKKHNKAHFMWRLMKPSKSYTQVQLQELTHVPYRSVRRYIEKLVVDGKVKAVGYGKGRRFHKK